MQDAYGIALEISVMKKRLNPNKDTSVLHQATRFNPEFTTGRQTVQTREAVADSLNNIFGEFTWFVVDELKMFPLEDDELQALHDQHVNNVHRRRKIS